jgi:excisionase family DNA binding protein
VQTTKRITHPADPPQMLSIAEVCDRLGFSESTSRRVIRDKALAFHKFGRVLRVSETDLADYVANCRGGTE